MTDLSDLIERVRAATGADTELDVALLPFWDARHEALRVYDERYETELADGRFSVRSKDGFYSSSAPFPRFTASIDAAIGLAERVLPGWEVQTWGGDPTTTEAGGRQLPRASLIPHLHNDAGWKAGRIDDIPAATLPLAITLATLLAVQATGAK